MPDTMNRRRLLGMVAAALGVFTGSDRARAANVSPQATCSWRLVSFTCVGGMRSELWALRCCDGSGCTVIRYETRPGASC